MSVHDPRVTLNQIRDAARRAQEICAGRNLDQLSADWQAAAALERFIEIVGEAVKRLPPELRSRHSGVPWKEIAGTRDHLSHGYDDVSYQILWDAVIQDVLVFVGRRRANARRAMTTLPGRSCYAACSVLVREAIEAKIAGDAALPWVCP